MTREEAERQRDRLAGEQPDVTWLVAETEPGNWNVVKVGIKPATATPTTAGTDPDPPPEDPRSADEQNIAPYGTWPWIGGLGGQWSIRRRGKPRD